MTVSHRYRIPVSRPCLGAAERSLIATCLTNNQLTIGPMVDRFERELAAYLGVSHCVATTSGTTALHLALVALGIGPGDEVLVPDLTFVATANAVSYTGATPVLVDVRPDTSCIDMDDAERKTTLRTKAVIPVHLYGVPCGIDAACSLGTTIAVIEDAAEGFGGRWMDYRLGAIEWSDCGVFSFYANKILTCGEGGAIVTDDADLAARLRFLRGQALNPYRRYFHDEIGFNYRMSDLHAAIGVGQLSHLDEMLASRHAVMARYRERLAGVGVWPVGVSAPWQFVMAVNDRGVRDGLSRFLESHGVETRPAFQPLHRMPMYKRASYCSTPGYDEWLDDTDFPVSSRIADTGICLPTYADMDMATVDEVCDLVLQFTATWC